MHPGCFSRPTKRDTKRDVFFWARNDGAISEDLMVKQEYHLKQKTRKPTHAHNIRPSKSITVLTVLL